MGFASGFRTGLASGGERRSMMPIVQGLGSMIDRIEARNKKGSIRYGGKIGGKSSYEKYTERKDAEEAAAEEKRRYDQAQTAQREQMETQRATQEATAEKQAEQAAVTEQRTAESHASKMETESQNREKAAKLYERSEKKEARIEAYRGFMQGIQSRNKALTEASWAALSPDMPEKEAKEWATIKTEEYINPETGQPEIDPQTGQPIKKYIVGRDKEGKESPNAMPAPSIEYNQDGSIAVTFPGEQEPQLFADTQEFAEQIGYHLNPEFEADQKARDTKKTKKAKSEKARLAAEKTKRDDQFKIIDRQRKRYQAKLDGGEWEIDKFRAESAKLDKKEDKLIAQVEGKEGKPQVAKGDGGYKMNPRTGTMGYAGEEAPADEPDAKRAPDGFWYKPGKGGGQEMLRKPEAARAELAKSH